VDTAQDSPIAIWSACTALAPATMPGGFALVSRTPFSMDLRWEPGNPGDCAFQRWDLEFRPWSNNPNEVSALPWEPPQGTCNGMGSRSETHCTVTGLSSNSFFDARLREACSNPGLDSEYTVLEMLSSAPAGALAPNQIRASSITQTTFLLEWEAGLARDCVFSAWSVDLKPSMQTDWIPVPECSLVGADRNLTHCIVVGLQSFTSYDLRLRERCVDTLADSPWAQVGELVTTQLGYELSVGPSTNGTVVVRFGATQLSACAYQQNCCGKEFGLCFGVREALVTRIDFAGHGWDEDVRLSCVVDPSDPSLLKRVRAPEPKQVSLVGRGTNFLSISWLVESGSAGYLSDCHCMGWTVEGQRTGEDSWLAVPGCGLLQHNTRVCELRELEGNWLLPGTAYSIRIRQTCSEPDLSSPFARIEADTLPGCDWSTHSGRDGELQCNDGGFCNVTLDDGGCCNGRGGRKRCPRDEPYMCDQRDGCARSQDYCCSSTPCKAADGGDRHCTIALSVHSSSAGVLNITWGSGAGVGFSPYAACSQEFLVAWHLNVDDVDTSTEVDASACLQTQPAVSGHSCELSALRADALYRVTVWEECADSFNWFSRSPRNASVILVSTLPRHGNSPSNVSILAVGERWLTLGWVPGNSIAECVFQAWIVEWRPQQSPGSGWTVEAACAGRWSRSTPTCKITGLHRNAPYEIRVKETCIDPRSDSLPAPLEDTAWTLPGEWEVHLGKSESMSAEVDVGYLPSRCTVITECCDDEFSVCFGGMSETSRLVTVFRTDKPSGWGQSLRLRCVALSIAAHTVAAEPEPASAPLALDLLEPTRNTLLARFSLGAAVGACTCASPRLQLRALGAMEWRVVGGDCADMSVRRCLLTGLAPDVRYEARLQVACADAGLDSNFTYAASPVATFPGCKWSTPNILEKFECADGVMCDSANDTCCAGHGGRARCPQSSPLLCKRENDCVDFTDRCCAADCSDHGGTRPCKEAEVPAKLPKIIDATSPAIGSLRLRWAPGEYLTGRPSGCHFYRWVVELAQVYAWGLGEWRHMTKCDPLERHNSVCELFGLPSATSFSWRVTETCANNAHHSPTAEAVVPATTRPRQAEPPVGIYMMLLQGQQAALLIGWTPGANTDCVFQAWSLEWRSEAGHVGEDLQSGAWVVETQCPGLLDYDSPSCTITSLQWHETYEVRVRQTCSDSRADSEPGRPRPFLWRGPGEWDVYVGSSDEVTVEVDALAPSRLCSVLNSRTEENFSTCRRESLTSLVTVSRTDQPRGWDQTLWLRCGNETVAGQEFIAPAAPDSVKLVAPTVNTVLAQFVLGESIGTCGCAAPHLQVRPEVEGGVWETIGGDCTSLSLRQCTVVGLLPNTRYHGRVQVACGSGTPSSAFTEAALSVVTLPGCKWSEDSGREEEFECADGTFCEMSNDTCCGDHGGRLRCPRKAPVMCMDERGCAKSTDRCCAADCGAQGGARPCTYWEVPALPPIIVEAASPAPATLSLTWSASEYLAGRSSGCVFLRWLVDVSQVIAGVEGEWIRVTACESEERRHTSCSVLGLVGLGIYRARVTETCTERALDSSHSYSERVHVHPYPATRPSEVQCEDFTAGSFVASWEPGLPMDCAFSSWQLEVRLLPRIAGISGDGRPEAELEGGDWLPGCSSALTGSRGQTSCDVPGLLSGREYGVRVREGCEDPRANSEFVQRDFGAACSCTPVPASPPIDLVGGDHVTPYSFVVRWVAGEPGACIFFAWEVQTKESNNGLWPTAVMAPDADFGCFLTDRGADKCNVSVGFGSGTRYDVRLREICTNSSLDSEWTYLPEPGITTALPAQAGHPSAVTIALQTPLSLTISWLAGTTGDCTFRAWRVEVSPQGQNGWVEQHECSTTTRTATYCHILTASLATTASIDVRVSETCDDPNADSVAVTAVSAILLVPVVAAPKDISLEYPGEDWLSLSWTPGIEHSSCDVKAWTVLWRLLDPVGDGVWTEASGCSAASADYTSHCNVTGLRQNMAHEVRVEEACQSPMSGGAVAHTTLPLWTLPGEWDIFVGASDTLSVQVDVLSPPYRCTVVKKGSTDEFSVCHEGLSGQQVTIMRTDIPGGWGQELWLRCSALALAPFSAETRVPASAPEWLELQAPSTESVVVTFRIGQAVGSCTCAAPRLQIRTDGSAMWSTIAACSNMALRQCTATGLLPGSTYHFRLQVACADADLDSNFTDARAPVTTVLPTSTIVGTAAVRGWRAESVFSEERRLIVAGGVSELDILARKIIAETAHVPVAALSVVVSRINASELNFTGLTPADVAQVDDAAEETVVVLDYAIAVAVIGKNRAPDGVEAFVDSVLELLVVGDDDICIRLVVALGGDGVSCEPLVEPHEEVRTEAFPSCGEPDAVTSAAVSWSPAICAARSWQDEPCEVPCAAGFWADGAYKCAVTGEWSPWPSVPRCIPEWTVGHWSTCSTVCGAGLRWRSVMCPGSGCEQERPSEEESCYATEGCVWVAGEWGACSSSCGFGLRNRSVTCSSGHAVDCPVETLADHEPCRDYTVCNWEVGTWGVCSQRCGLGTQVRSVVCPSENLAHCGDTAPTTVKFCHDESGCEWQVSEWSACSNGCGMGVAYRDVWCPSGADSDCTGAPPLDSMACNGNDNCHWIPGPWGNCSSTCGLGMQNRSLTCSSGHAQDCPTSLVPATKRSCFANAGCSWLVSDWGACSNECGLGFLSRSVTCPTGTEQDCPSNRPTAWSVCYSTDGCMWNVGKWSACSVSCGQGERKRAVWCSSANSADCGDSRPLTVAACRNVTTCTWHIGEWSKCSNTCGSGEALRSVSCPSGSDVDCRGERPADSRSCVDESGCGCVVGGWSACNATCGAGWQSRTVKCRHSVIDDGTDYLPSGPSTLQRCYNASGCIWLVDAWSNCSNRCGAGSRTRRVACSSGSDTDCTDLRPMSEEQCWATDACSWVVLDWGDCSTSCGRGTRARSAWCPSRSASDCGLPAPVGIEVCINVTGCAWDIGEWSACSSGCGDGAMTRRVACPSGRDADCPGDIPQSSRSCRGVASCEWQVGTWSECSSSCGEGVELREVWCLSGRSEDCPRIAPVGQRPCHKTSACIWMASDWSECSSICGPGVRTRYVRCSSGVDADCSHNDIPVDREGCSGQLGSCEWMVGDWNNCSATQCGGLGTRKRPVSCSSLQGIDGCVGARPQGVEECVSNAICAWHVSEWSVCDNSCGPGKQVRNVSCLGSLCMGPEPASVRTCHCLDGCGWETGPWSACSSGCGPGVQTRNATCMGGACEGQGPKMSQPCFGTMSCRWIVGDWTACSMECGDGHQSRNVSCSSTADKDCAAWERPVDRRQCHGSWGCRWVLSEWSLCSARCGSGSQRREVRCSGGREADCETSLVPRPTSVRRCVETLGCAWQVSPWTECSGLCGNDGVQHREVECPGVGFDAGSEELIAAAVVSRCPGSRPAESRACQVDSCSSWRLGEWSRCSATCGAGVQRRNVSCPDRTVPCLDPPPPSSRRCIVNASCQWIPLEWSVCSSLCGWGWRTREVLCQGNGCPIRSRPNDVEECRDISGCEWRTSAWSSCGTGSCRPRTREVVCPTGHAANCSGSNKPSLSRVCDAPGCADAGETAVFYMSMLLEAPLDWDKSTSRNGEDMTISVATLGIRAAVARALAKPVAAVSVRALPPARRRLSLAEGELSLSVEVTVEHVGAGIQALIDSSALLHGALAGFVQEELAIHGLEVGRLAVIEAAPANHVWEDPLDPGPERHPDPVGSSGAGYGPTAAAGGEGRTSASARMHPVTTVILVLGVVLSAGALLLCTWFGVGGRWGWRVLPEPGPDLKGRSAEGPAKPTTTTVLAQASSTSSLKEAWPESVSAPSPACAVGTAEPRSLSSSVVRCISMGDNRVHPVPY